MEKEGKLVGRFRSLSLALIFSGALNIGLIAALVFSAFEKNGSTSLSSEPFKSSEILERMNRLSFRELLSLLSNKEAVEENLKKRDLALAILAAKYDFDLHRSLGKSSIAHKKIALLSGKEIPIYLSLNEEEFEAIIQFASGEKWPFTAKGLFTLLKKMPKESRDKSLKEAFYTTHEFHAIALLFQKNDVQASKEDILDLLTTGPWELITSHLSNPASAHDFSLDRKKAFLMSYVPYAPSIAQDLLEVSVQEEKVEVSQPLPKKREHVVKVGENLWKISRIYQVQIDQIRELNELASNQIYPGMTLLIP